MTTQLAFGRDYQGYSADAPDFSTNIQTVVLASGGAKTLTIPSNYKNWIMYIQVQPGGWCWVSRNGTAAIPSGSGSFATSVSEMAAGTVQFRKKVFAADIISFVTPNTTCDISVSLFAIQP